LGTESVFSYSGEPIHKVATRGVKLWKEFEDTVFALPREKRAAWLADKKDYVIKRLNADFQKPWVRDIISTFHKSILIISLLPQFAAKADGTVCDVGDMTYAEVASRMLRLMYVSHEKRWIDPTLKKLLGDWLRRVRNLLSEAKSIS